MARNTSLATKNTTSSDPIELLEQAEVLRRRAEQSFGEYALEAGRLLIAAKRKIPHGSWASHIAEHTGFSLRTAEVYMRARKRYDALPQAERESVLEQPFTRSLLVLAQAPRPALPDAPVEQAIRRTATPNGNTQTDIKDFLEQRDIETTKLMQAAVDYTPEPTPFDDIEEIVGRPASPAVAQEEETDELDFNQQTPAQREAEMLEELQARDLEIQRLETEVRRANMALESARQANLTAVAPPNPQRGWDYVSNLFQYLKADEPQRTPETLARRASTLSNGREVISYLEQFFAAARTQLNQIA